MKSQRIKILVETFEDRVRTVTLSSLVKPALILFSYDTDAVRRIIKRREEDFCSDDEYKMVLPARYALVYHHGFDDVGIIAQVHLSHKKYRDEAQWFNEFRDLPYAITALRNRFPEKKMPEQIIGMFDWPFDRRKKHGESLVSTEEVVPA